MIEFLTALLGVQVVVMLAAIPWAYSVHGRIASMEARLTAALDLSDKVADLGSRMVRLEFSMRD